MQNAQLLEYIRQERSRGMTPEHIRGNLITAGWNVVDVEQAFTVLGLTNPPAPVPQPAPVATPAPAVSPVQTVPAAATPVTAAAPVTPATPATPVTPIIPRQPIPGVPVKPATPPVSATPINQSFQQPMQAQPMQTPPMQAAQQPQSAADGIKYAGFWIRLVAAVIDAFIVGTVAGIIGAIIAGQSNGVKITIFLVVAWLYFILTTEAWGATLGKRILGLRVVAVETNEPLSFGKIIIREVIGKLILAIILLIGFIMIAFTDKKQGLHDKIVRSAVIYNDPNNESKVGLIVGIILAFVFVVGAGMIALSMTVTTSLNTARAKGADAAMKSNLNNIRAEAELYFNNNSGSYSNSLDCSSGMFADSTIQGTLSAISTEKTCYAAGTSYAVSAKFSTGNWCVDSTGFSGTGNAVASDGKAACSAQ